jgi:glyceraldehyde-3-phosphate dehydrogenase/erythrose-4-phosphate dehydrogenase
MTVPPAAIDWGELGADIVVESTGRFRVLSDVPGASAQLGWGRMPVRR